MTSHPRKCWAPCLCCLPALGCKRYVSPTCHIEDLKLPSQRIDSEPHRVQRMARWGCGADAVGEALGRKRCIDKANGLGELLTREAHSRTDSA
jgi:hypothetical protein